MNNPIIMNNVKIYFIILFLGAFAQSISSQDSGMIQDNILYNDYPYVVNMTQNGEITEFVRTAPEVMNGQQWDKNAVPPMPLGSYTKPVYVAQEYNSPLNTTVIGDKTMNNTDVASNDTNEAPGSTVSSDEFDDEDDDEDEEEVVSIKPTNDKPMKTTVIRRDKEDDDEVEVVIRRTPEEERNSFSYDMEFQGYTARLTPDLITKLEDISKVYEQNTDKSLEIRSFVTANDETNKNLAINRMDACRSMLIKYGVPSNKITTGIRPYRSSQTGQVNISFVEQNN